MVFNGYYWLLLVITEFYWVLPATWWWAVDAGPVAAVEGAVDRLAVTAMSQ